MTEPTANIDDEQTREARVLLEAYLKRLSTGVARLAFALILFWILSQLVWLSHIVFGVGLSDAWRGGAFGHVFWSAVKFAAVGVVVAIGAGPTLRRLNADMCRRGVLAPARITQGPEFALARVFGSALDIFLLDRVFGFFLPCRLVNFDYEYQGQRHPYQVGGLYPDEVAGEEVSGDEDDRVFALVDPQNPHGSAWLLRRSVLSSC